MLTEIATAKQCHNIEKKNLLKFLEHETSGKIRVTLVSIN